MNDEALAFLKQVGIGSVNPHALYVLIESKSGILLEDLAPLMASLEIVYRRVLTLYLDPGVRDLLETRHSEKASLAGVSRSITSRYMKLLVSKEKEYTTPSIAFKKKILENATFRTGQNAENYVWHGSHPYTEGDVPCRVSE